MITLTTVSPPGFGKIESAFVTCNNEVKRTPCALFVLLLSPLVHGSPDRCICTRRCARSPLLSASLTLPLVTTRSARVIMMIMMMMLRERGVKVGAHASPAAHTLAAKVK